MSIVFLNGEFVEENEAKVSINDAGYYYGDGVYEVVLVYDRKLIDCDLHLERLMNCFQKVFFKNCPTKEEILDKMQQLVKKNEDIDTGSIYLQFTRGNKPRTHSFINDNLKPNWLMKMSSCKLNEDLSKTWHCNIVEDPRRMRCDIKMISLLPMVLSKYENEKAGFDDIIFYNSRVKSITEGSCFNVFIVDQNDKIITYPISNEILPGCTRARIISFLKENNYEFEERKYSKDELLNAKEVFATGSLKVIMPVIKVEGREIGDGKVGKITKEINDIFIKYLNS